ncbi:unnamed protein product, partial [Amoebophrya sp. A120]
AQRGVRNAAGAVPGARSDFRPAPGGRGGRGLHVDDHDPVGNVTGWLRAERRAKLFEGRAAAGHAVPHGLPAVPHTDVSVRAGSAGEQRVSLRREGPCAPPEPVSPEPAAGFSGCQRERGCGNQG